MLSLSVSMHTAAFSPSEKEILKSKATEALFEFCHYSVTDERCNKLNTELGIMEPEMYLFRDTYKEKVLVIYTLDHFHPHVILLYDSDGSLHVVVSGILLSHKQEFVNQFLISGDFIDDKRDE